MKKTLIFLILLSATSSLFSQVTFSSHIVSSSRWAPQTVFAADIDGDGDMDIVCGAEGDELVEWYENLDGQGSFSSSHLVADGYSGLYSVFVVDIDGDGDMDILSSAIADNEVAWFENLDGEGSFGPRRIISDIEVHPYEVHAADMDGDNDVDVLTISQIGNKVYWHENLDGQGNFGPAILLFSNVSWPQFLKAGDVDGDGDNDAFVSAVLGDDILWTENVDGLGNFGPTQVITDNLEGAYWIYLFDLDQDDDLDVISTAREGGGLVVWYPNTDGLGSFGSQEIISMGTGSVSSAYPVDFDNDGDFDIVHTTAGVTGITGGVYWNENLGNQNFGTNIVIIDEDFDNSRYSFVADFDGDGDMDVVATSWADDKITWFENMTPLGINDIETVDFLIHPNPASNIIEITCSETIVSVELFNILGQKVQNVSNTNVLEIDHLQPGMYFVQITNDIGLKGRKKIIKK